MFLHQDVICSHLAGVYRIDVGLTWFAWPHPLSLDVSQSQSTKNLFKVLFFVAKYP